MNANEGLTPLGWLLIGVVLLEVLVALKFGFASLFYFAILLVPVAFAVMLILCAAKAPGET
jgi:hypothetical protein